MNGPHEHNNLIADRYLIESFVGEGGMQYVYKAFDQILSRDIALKTPKNISAEKRFLRSATVASKVNHPNVAKTLDYLKFEDREYLVEELIVGADIDKAILQKSKYIDPYLVAHIFHNLAKGLAASHHVGVIHRDLKPTNVMVSGGFCPTSIKITDFGIAKMAGEELTEAAVGGNETITGSQTAIGALPYMAPEAISAPLEVTESADVWSLGAMMYELLAGEKPFGSGLMAVSKIMNGTPPIFPLFITNNIQFKPLANALKSIILECLVTDPDNRISADGLVEKCSSLCYLTSERIISKVRYLPYPTYGFISGFEADIFFNMESVYGDRPAVGDNVMYSAFEGRAHPVVKLV
jgi:serine/threonine protein kinase